jgi:hypothetical protein
MDIMTKLADESEVLEILRDALQEQYVEVTFTKVNGDVRVMTCTSNLDLIPIDHHPKGTGNVIHTDKVARVYDVNKEEWRSFRWKNVTEFREI